MKTIKQILANHQAEKRRKQFLAYKFKQLTDKTLLERMQAKWREQI